MLLPGAPTRLTYPQTKRKPGTSPDFPTSSTQGRGCVGRLLTWLPTCRVRPAVNSSARGTWPPTFMTRRVSLACRTRIFALGSPSRLAFCLVRTSSAGDNFQIRIAAMSGLWGWLTSRGKANCKPVRDVEVDCESPASREAPPRNTKQALNRVTHRWEEQGDSAD
jgi:hypothetical protein